jgi:hypothetical protein
LIFVRYSRPRDKTLTSWTIRRSKRRRRVSRKGIIPLAKPFELRKLPALGLARLFEDFQASWILTLV